MASDPMQKVSGDSPTTAQTVLATSMCNGQYGVAAWDKANSEVRAAFIALAACTIRELAAHEWTLVAIEDVQNVSA